MKRFILPSATAAALLLAACLAAPADPTSPTTTDDALTGLKCKGNERAFNGACRQTCTSNAQCGAPNRCMTVSAGVALCVDYASCAHLGSDTECGGITYGGYGEYSSSDETIDIPPPPVPYGYSSAPVGCAGNATWKVAKAAPNGELPFCGSVHNVTRCQKSGSRCALVPATAMDLAER